MRKMQDLNYEVSVLLASDSEPGRKMYLVTNPAYRYQLFCVHKKAQINKFSSLQDAIDDYNSP